MTGLAPMQTPAWQLSRLRAAVAVAARCAVRLGRIRADAGLCDARAHVVALVGRRAGHRAAAGAALALAGRPAVQGFESLHVVPFALPAQKPQGILIFAVRQPPGMKQWPALPLKNCSLLAVHVALNRQCPNGSRNVAWPLVLVVLFADVMPSLEERRHRPPRDRDARPVDDRHHRRLADADRRRCAPRLAQ